MELHVTEEHLHTSIFNRTQASVSTASAGRNATRSSSATRLRPRSTRQEGVFGAGRTREASCNEARCRSLFVGQRARVFPVASCPAEHQRSVGWQQSDVKRPPICDACGVPMATVTTIFQPDSVKMASYQCQKCGCTLGAPRRRAGRSQVVLPSSGNHSSR